jgi:hypothetical protein
MSRKEFDRQIQNLLQKGYPRLAGVPAEEFTRHIEPLREKIKEVGMLQMEPTAGNIPFVIVVKSEWVAGEKAMQQVELKDKKGFTVMEADDLKRFSPIEGVILPQGMAYLVVDVDSGKKTLNITPDEAIQTIRQENRSPLTIEEGIALITHHPEILSRNNCFSLLGSRCGDRRVTALWISRGKPKLGWCWAGNPHTWLGSASCSGRVGP